MDMKEIIQAVEKTTADVLEKSNEVYPLFRNPHEACAVIREELEEAAENEKDVALKFGDLWDLTREDNLTLLFPAAKELSKQLGLQIAELIQAKAMADKVIQSKKKIENFYDFVEIQNKKAEE